MGALLRRARGVLLASTVLVGVVGAADEPRDSGGADAAVKRAQTPLREPTTPSAPADLSARARRGTASFYAPKFSGRKMADGHPMDPHADNAASKTLPLGTTARATNVETGLSTTVTIEDRGPYVRGRIVDLSPTTAREIGIDHHNGIATVVVAPIAVPLPSGRVRRGPTPDARTLRRAPTAEPPR